MDLEIEPELSGAATQAGSQREMDLEAKLSKRTLLLTLFVVLALTELLVMVEVLRHAT